VDSPRHRSPIGIVGNDTWHERASSAEGPAARHGALSLQFGVISPEGARIAEDGGPRVITDRCMKVEHARHLGRMHWLGFNTGVVTARRSHTLA
jgi:hypothetical protein